MKKISWKPKYNEEFYYITMALHCAKTTNIEHITDVEKIEAGNYFKTQEDCKQAITEIKETFNKFHEEE